jgi:hypothetical protein
VGKITPSVGYFSIARKNVTVKAFTAATIKAKYVAHPVLK